MTCWLGREFSAAPAAHNFAMVHPGTLLVVASCAAAAWAFAPAARPAAPSSATRIFQFQTQAASGYVNVEDLYSPRDVQTMEQWATQYGLQKADGVQLYSEDGGNDYSLMTNSGIGAGQSVLYVPSDIVLNSAAIQQELGGSLQAAEQYVCQFEQGESERLPLLRLMAKILVEFEKGTDSLWFPWLNSLPRQYFNGVSMTKACFNCLPPYAGWLTETERINYSHFALGLRQGYVPLSQETIGNKDVVKWAYNVAFTRFHEVWQGEKVKVIAPMVDFLNHAAEPNCQIDVGPDGSVQVVALYDIPAGSPLTVSYGDPTNPTPLFAQYGFLPQDCATIFCKAMHLDPVIKTLGYEFRDLLIQTETGEIAPPVYDIFLYDVLQNNDMGAAQQFYQAVQSGDEGTKEQMHSEWFPYTLASLKEHVYSIMSDCEMLTMRAQSYDQNQHPRVPVIVAHNQLVSQTFGMTAALLEQMG